MSKYDDQYDSSNCICPYCKYSYRVECEDYSEDERDQECEDCGKKFYFSQVYSVDHHAVPDCELNGEEHQWEPRGLGDGTTHPWTTHPFCTECNKCQPVVCVRVGDDKEEV